MLSLPKYPALLFSLISAFFLKLTAIAVAESTDPETVAQGVPDALSQEAISALVSKLDADQVNALTELMRLLGAAADSAAAAPINQESLFTLLRGWVTSFGNDILEYIIGLPELFGAVGAAILSIFANRSLQQTLLLIAITVGLVAAGFAAEWLFNRRVARWRSRIQTEKPETLLQTVQVVSSRFLLDVGGLLAFTITVLAGTSLLIPDSGDQALVSNFVIYVILLPLFMAAILRFALAPKRRELRLVASDDWTANFIHSQFVTLFAIVGVAMFLMVVMETSDMFIRNMFRFWVGLLGNAWVIYVTWKARKGLTSIIIGEEKNLSGGLERMATWWPYVSMAFIALNWLVIQFSVSIDNSALTPGRGLVAVLLIILAPFFDTMLRGIVAHIVPAMEGEGPVAEQAYRETKFSYIRIGRIILIALLVMILGKIYGVNLRGLTEAGLGAQIAANIVQFLLILAIGYLAWEITNLWINRKLAKDSPPMEDDAENEMGGAGKSRLATILPIFRMAMQVAIITITVLLALGQIGVNITPLLAGAGVLGLAIGFGAQTLVKDVVSGVFFLMDDAFRLGEFIDAAGTQGTVEKISIRSLQLRGTKGAVHIVPYGEIPKLTNLSRDWVIMKLRFTVPFDTDIEKVRKIFKRIGQEIMEDPELAEGILAPFKSQGVADVDDVGIVVRGKFTTEPGKQFTVRREIYARVQKAFEENDIQFARKEVRVQIPDSEGSADMTPEQKQAIAAAVSEAAEKPPAEKT